MVETVDGSWGTKQDNGEWNGMVGMILRGDVEIGVASFVATNERHEAVDFSTILGWYAKEKRTPFACIFIQWNSLLANH